MARILMLTDRARDGLGVFQTALRLAEWLNADDIAAMVAGPQQLIVPAGFDVATPDSGLTTMWLPPLPIDLEGNGPEEVATLFRECQHEALWRGMRCETQRTRLTFVNAAATVARLFGLMVMPREALLDETGSANWLRGLCSEVDRPLLLTSHEHEIREWRRIVVVGGSPRELNELMLWGEHWGTQLRLPLLPIDLPQPTRSLWPAMRRMWQCLSPAAHRQAVREALDTFGLGPHDLLLTGRNTLFWPDHASGLWISPGDLIDSPLAAVGLLPTTLDRAVCQLLFDEFDSFDAPPKVCETFAA